MSFRRFAGSRPHGRHRAVRLVSLALILLVVTGCTAGPSQRPAVLERHGGSEPPTPTAGPVPVPPLDEPTDSTVRWQDCDDKTRERIGGTTVPESFRFSCARIVSTLDAPELPRRGLIRVSVLKVGTGPTPLAVVNDIDGEPGTIYAAKLAATLPPEILQRFFIVGMDRRGSGDSTPISCIPEEARSQLVGHDPTNTSIDPLLDAARKAGQECTIDLGQQQQAFDTWRAAGDLEELRDQLGAKRINAIGHGEGSKVLTAYSARYPGTVGRFVLDGVPDPSPELTTKLADLAASAQSTLDALGTFCAARSCPLGADSQGAVAGLVTQLRQNPLPWPGGVADAFGPGHALNAVLIGLADRPRWPELVDAIVAARGGDAGKLAGFLTPLIIEDEQPARIDGSLATTCNDTVNRTPVNDITKVVADLQTKYPTFGGIFAGRLAWCNPWPVRSEPAPPSSAPGTPPVLVISTATDPVTPEAGTVRATNQLPDAHRVSWQGAGHYAFAAPCVAEAARGLLIDGVLAADGTICPP